MKKLNVAFLLLSAALCFSPAYAAKFKVAVLPDTQHYSKEYPATFTAQTQWIVNNKSSQSIAFVTHLGDIVQNADDASQWTNANASMNILNGQLPYSVCIGNHDYDAISEKRGTEPASIFKSYFGNSRYTGYNWYGGTSPKGLSFYQIFPAGGRNWLHLNLEWEPGLDILMWAQNIIDANPTLPVILSTHAYMSYHDPCDPNSTGLRGGTQGDAASGGYEMWHKFVQHNDQIIMTLNGHYDHEDHITFQNVYGRNVYSLTTDYQGRENGGNGFLNLIEFDFDNDAINVKTYSPTLNQWETDANSQFTFNIDLDARLSNFNSREAVNGIPAANIDIVNDGTGVVTMTIPAGQGTSDFYVINPANTGDYSVKIGTNREDDQLGGVLITAVSELGRNWTDGDGLTIFRSHTPMVNLWDSGQFDIGVSMPSLEYIDEDGEVWTYGRIMEGDCNVAAAYFPFSRFIGAHCQLLVEEQNNVNYPQVIYSAAGNGVVLGQNLTQFPSYFVDPELIVPKAAGNLNWAQNDADRGIFDFYITGVNSLTDGIVLGNAGGNEDNYFTASPYADGRGWQLAVNGNDSDHASECDAFSFVYIPYSTPGIVAGRVSGDSAGIVSGTGGFKVEFVSEGTHRLRIYGCTPADGVLLLTGENHYYDNDEYLTYKPDDINDCWIIQNRDLPESKLDSSANAEYVFAFIPFDGQTAPFDGNGTEAYPYLIYTKTDLEMVDYYPAAYFKLMNNIDLSGTTYTKALIAPDGNGLSDGFEGTEFSGSFDGNGYTIQNLTIDAGTGDHVGLFGYLKGATIKNLSVTGTVTAGHRTGGVTGYCGYSSYLINCHSSVMVNGTTRVGGLAGDCYISTVTNCSATGSVTGTGAEYAGGISGQLNTCTITGSYATGNVTGLARVGGLAGNLYMGSAESCYATGNVSGTGTSYVGGFVGQCYANTVTNCYATGTVTGGDGTDRVGGFVGNLYLPAAVVDNCYALGNVTASGQSVGGFVGANQQGYIEDSYATGNVTATKKSSDAEGSYIGGFVGYNYASTSNVAAITRCYAAGSVSGDNHVGGFVGYNYGSTTTYTANITKCYAMGNATAVYYVGGFCGRDITYGYISQSHATGNATGTGKAGTGETEAGGFIGRMSGNSFVDNCYATGSASVAYKRAGGFVGGHWGTLTNCYSTGTATGPAEVGGFCGYGTASTTSCYWDTQTSGLASSTVGTGKTTAQMKQQATFTGWDFVTAPIWKIRETLSCPKLNWQSFIDSDIDYSGAVDFADLKVIADNWLATGSGLAGDIYVDNTVNFKDFAQFAADWCEQ